MDDTPTTGEAVDHDTTVVDEADESSIVTPKPKKKKKKKSKKHLDEEDN